jgi:Pyruvate/2-oxoacid:ferredoxin oxidoreductase delta subunit
MYERFQEKFQVPKCAQSILASMFSKDAFFFVENIDKEVFDANDIQALIPHDPDFEKTAYKDGLISLTEESFEDNPLYRLNNFYGALDVFVVSKQDIYRTFEKETRLALDEWYFQAYLNGLDPNLSTAPTKDRILSLEQTCDFIDAQKRDAYLNFCDCRSLRGDCGLTTRTCITYRSGINTFVHRGHSISLSKEEAKEVVRKADAAGLMHTVNPNGICNCCGDCCYLFRAQKARNSTGLWPKAQYQVFVNEEKCIGCGKCARRCHFSVFKMENRKAKAAHLKSCVGCGICATGCPVDAIEMKERIV